jgi:peroxiredoxin
MKIIPAIIVLIFLVSFAHALDPGQKAAGFSLTGSDGKVVKLSDLHGKPVVIVFISTRCPYSRAFTASIAQVGRDYKSKGVEFFGINSNNNEPVEEVAQHAKQNFPFPVLKDAGSNVANQYGAQVTPEVFLIDAAGIIQYHGAVGNSSDPTTDPSRANAQELRAALDELLARKPISKAKTKAFGCTIKRIASASFLSLSGSRIPANC